MKKIISITLVCVMILSLAQITALGATAPEVAETQFSEDFEAYQLINDYEASRYWDVKNQKNSAYSGEIYNGIPADGVYTDTTLYPNGTASVYEGNLDDSGNTYVHDYTYKNAAAANEGKIIGGTVDIGQDDGWYGYTNTTGQQFNVYNRRLAVFNIAGTSDVNKTQYAILQPKSTTGATYSSLSRNNIAINGYSYLTARVSLSSETGYGFTKAGVTVTKNPDKHTFSGEKELVYFVEDDEGKENVLDVMFNGARIAEVKNNRFAYQSTGTKTEYTGEWYTIQYRMWIDGDVKKHNLTLIDDTTKEVIYKSGWKTMYGDFEFDAETYGLKFYAQTADSTARTCLRLDDIRFYNGTFVEDFDGYNIKASKNGTNDRIGNGPRGNRNAVAKYSSSDTEAVKIYENGVYEGNFAKNVFVHHVLKDNTANYDTIFGGNSNWQGYVKVIKNINEVRYLTYSSTWQYDNEFKYSFGVNQSDGPVQLRYKASPKVFYKDGVGSTAISSNTTILWVPHPDLASQGVDLNLYCKRGTTSNFTTDQYYYINSYTVNNTSVAADILIAYNNGEDRIDSFTRPVIVTKVIQSKNNYGEFATKIFGVQENKEVQIASEQLEFKDKNGATVTVEPGDLVRCALNTKGDCVSMSMLYDHSDYEEVSASFSTGYRAIRGSVYQHDKNIMLMVKNNWNIDDEDIKPSNMESQVCTSSAKIYLFNEAKKTLKKVTSGNLIDYKFDKANYSRVVVANSYASPDLIVIYE